MQIGCFKVPSSRTLKHWGNVSPGILSIFHGGKISFFTCLSVPLLDVIFFKMSKLIGSPLIAELLVFQLPRQLRMRLQGQYSVIIQPPQPPQHECLAIRLGRSGSLMCSIGAFCPRRTSSGGNADFLHTPCQRILPYAADRLEGQCTKYIEGLPCNQPPRD